MYPQMKKPVGILGYVHQTSHMFSFNGVFHDMKQTTYFADDWWQDKISMRITILAIIIHDISCRYGNMRHYQ
jgi:hypothetical protein